MKRIETSLPGVCLLEPVVHGDSRGFLMETWNRRTFEQLGIVRDWVQENYSRSGQGVLRGLHYQVHQPQAKLVRVAVGHVYDVAVDVRRGSPTFRQWVAAELSDENRRMLFIPEGFAHGYYVLSKTVEFAYKCSDFYVPQAERGIIWNDPDLGIDWPLSGACPRLSEKDAAYGTLATRSTQDLPQYVGDAE